ncbi:hypothetical protein QYM36_000721 [Artemia franciscana]|uniref:Protein unc-45 homolog B n=1 Tax=Artemia franciscana TaxID=6661 RepID=A0AA88IM85_ARTSF|nr:hypothetical protein QYM36_000721 [Artemia franciscana]
MPVADSGHLYKEEGNKHFKEGNWDSAIEEYSKAISVTKDHTLEKAVYYKNRAAAHLKQQEFEKAIEDCTKALEISPSDTKALFRRCQAYDALGKFEEAYKDARTVHNVDPGNTAIQPILARLHEIVANKVAEHSKLSSKVSQMLNLAFDISTPIDKRETAANNILVLAKEKAGAELLYKEGILNRIVSLFKIEKNQNIIVNLIRSISVIAKNNADKARGIIEIIGLPWIIELLNTRYEEQISAAQYCLQTLLDALSGMTLKDEKTPDMELCSRNRKEIDTLITCLIYALTSRTMTGVGRDAMIELILRNCDYRALDWAERIIDINGSVAAKYDKCVAHVAALEIKRKSSSCTSDFPLNRPSYPRHAFATRFIEILS